MDFADALWILPPMHDSSKAGLFLLSEAMIQGRLIRKLADGARYSRRLQLISDDFTPVNIQV